MTFALTRILLIVAGILGLAASTTQAAPAESLALTPRVFLPLMVRKAQAELPSHVPFGASDGTLTKLAFTQHGMNTFLGAGAVYNRMSVSWRDIEPSNRAPEDYVWNEADRLINPLLDRGVQPFVLLLNNPAWAASSSCGPVHDVRDLEEYVGALAARFPEVEYWGLYNEADLMTYSTRGASSGGCFGEPDLNGNGNPDYADYAEMARGAWKAIHTANPKAHLSIGQLSYDNFTPETRPPWYPGGCCFNYYCLGNLMGYFTDNPLPPGEKYADVVGFNDYLLYNDAVWQPRYSGVGVGAKAAALREVMQAHGQDFPLAISEMSGGSTHATGIPREQQARQVAQMMVQGFFYEIRTLIWWTFDDYADACVSIPNCANWKFGLVESNLTPKPSLETFETVVTQLRGYAPVNVRNGSKVVEFTFAKGGFEKKILYTKNPEGKRKTFKAKTLLVTDMYGNQTFYRHKGNQKIKMQLTPDPIYVEINP